MMMLLMIAISCYFPLAVVQGKTVFYQGDPKAPLSAVVQGKTVSYQGDHEAPLSIAVRNIQGGGKQM